MPPTSFGATRGIMWGVSEIGGATLLGSFLSGNSTVGGVYIGGGALVFVFPRIHMDPQVLGLLACQKRVLLRALCVGNGRAGLAFLGLGAAQQPHGSRGTLFLGAGDL